MKKTIISGVIIFAAIFSINFIARSQFVPEMDEINIDQFDLVVTGASPSLINTISLGEQEFLQKFGPPISSGPYYSEMEERDMNHYVYDGAEAYFLDDNLEAFRITSPNYCFQLLNGTKIKVGDDISSVSGLFPGSWSSRLEPHKVFIALRNQGVVFDMSLLFEFNTNTNLITNISVNY